jgi:hypothetical protein
VTTSGLLPSTLYDHLLACVLSAVNVPGTYYVAGATANDMSAATCPPDTYGTALQAARRILHLRLCLQHISATESAHH